MATKKQRRRAQRESEVLAAEALASRLMSGSDAPLTPQTIAAVAPATRAQSFANVPYSVEAQQKFLAGEAAAAALISGADVPVGQSAGDFITGAIEDAQAAAGTGNAPKPGSRTVTPPARTEEPDPLDAIVNLAMKKLAEYNLKGIADSLQRARNAYPELELNDLLFLVENDERYNTPFKDRFKANELRFTKGLPRLKASEYLKLEQDYARLFTTYNLPAFKNQSQYDKLIAGDVDIDDATDRVVKAYDRVISDTSTRNAFRQFYSAIEDSDIVSALLDPEQQIPALEKKVVAAEIGGQALRQGLSTSLSGTQDFTREGQRPVSGYTNVQRGTLGAEALAGEGVTEAAAAADYQRIAEQLPTAEKLSAIYGGRAEQVSQRELEQAEILGLESAKRKQRQLAGMEEATFSGEAGTMRTSLGRRGRQGAF
jgi:hypothetical protein